MHIKGFSFVELLIVCALSMVILFALFSFFTTMEKSKRHQEQKQTLLDEARSLTQFWQSDFSSVGDLGCQTSSQGIKIYNIDQDSLPPELPKAIVKKLLPHSVVVLTEHADSPFLAAQIDTEKQRVQVPAKDLASHHLLLLSSCTQAKIFSPQQSKESQGVFSFNAPFAMNSSTLYLVAKWQRALWFAMKNNQGNYGIYRLLLDEESSPAEFVSDVDSFQASAFLDNNFVPVSAVLPWGNVTLLRFKLHFKKNTQSLDWPIHVFFMRKALGFRNVK